MGGTPVDADDIALLADDRFIDFVTEVRCSEPADLR